MWPDQSACRRSRFSRPRIRRFKRSSCRHRFCRKDRLPPTDYIRPEADISIREDKGGSPIDPKVDAMFDHASIGVGDIDRRNNRNRAEFLDPASDRGLSDCAPTTDNEADEFETNGYDEERMLPAGNLVSSRPTSGFRSRLVSSPTLGRSIWQRRSPAHQERAFLKEEHEHRISGQASE
ncbi:hypothetical protein J2W42_005817 [Rhizobium tibeticum]|nr:hypothetical protein [Rhizobium tibeticum]